MEQLSEETKILFYKLLSIQEKADILLQKFTELETNLKLIPEAEVKIISQRLAEELIEVVAEYDELIELYDKYTEQRRLQLLKSNIIEEPDFPKAELFLLKSEIHNAIYWLLKRSGYPVAMGKPPSHRRP